MARDSHIYNESQSVHQIHTNSVINYNDPYFLSTGDNSNSQLGQIIFNGSNYFNREGVYNLYLMQKTIFILLMDLFCDLQMIL